MIIRKCPNPEIHRLHLLSSFFFLDKKESKIKAELLGDPAVKQRPETGISSKAFFVLGALADNHIR